MSHANFYADLYRNGSKYFYRNSGADAYGYAARELS